MRSRPANASVICVPIDAIETSGAATSPMKKMYMKKSPSVIRPAMMSRPPSQIITMLITPMIDVAAGGGRGHAGHRLRDVAEEAMRALRKDDLLALLRGVALDHANAAKRFGETTRDFGVDLAALAEQRTQHPEGVRHPASEQAEHEHRDEREPPVDVEEDAETRARR